jgi:hypothetical protein
MNWKRVKGYYGYYPIEFTVTKGPKAEDESKPSTVLPKPLPKIVEEGVVASLVGWDTLAAQPDTPGKESSLFCEEVDGSRARGIFIGGR